MTSIWTPKEKPVVLDKYCHLSLDAQKVMASMYRDFHQRKAEIKGLTSYPSERLTGLEHSRRESHAHQTILNQRCSSVDNISVARNNKSNHYNNDISTLCNSIPVTRSSVIDSSNGREDKNNHVSNRDDNVDSPPVETRDFEILSQFHIVDTQHDLFSDSPSEFDRNAPALLHESEPNKGQVEVDKTSDRDAAELYTGSKGRLSASLLNCSPRFRHLNERSTDIEQSGLKLLEKNEESALYKSWKENLVQPCLLNHGQYNMAKCSENGRYFYDSERGKSELKEDISKQYNSNMKTSMHSNPNINNSLQCEKVMDGLLGDEILCEESPFLDRTTEVSTQSYSKTSKVNCPAQDSSSKKNHKLKQTKIMFERLGSEVAKDAKSKTFSGQKRFTDEVCSKIPVKKFRNCSLNSNNQEADISEHTLCSCTYINKLPMDTLDEVCAEILTSEELVLCLVFTDGSTQFRGNLLAPDSNKKKTAGKVKKDSEIDSLAVCSTSPLSDKVYLFPMQHQKQEIREKLSEFWKSLLSRDDIRKIGFKIKEVFLALYDTFGYEYNKVDLSWTVMDASVALWLLDPDNPVSSFEQLLSALKMPEQAPSQSCIDALQADMASLSAAMKELFQKLQCRDMWNLFVCLETKLTTVLAGMERRQITINIHTLLHFSEVIKRNLTSLEEKAHKAAGHAFVLNSHHQLRQVLFEELKLDSNLPGKAKLAKTSVTRETSTSETVLTQLLPFHPLPEIILEYRQLQKLKSTYIDGILSCVSDSYLTTHWDQTSAATGRLSSYHPNIQAIPKLPVIIKDHQKKFIVGRMSSETGGENVVQFNARDPFISRPQWTLLSADFQQIELRLLSHLADDPLLLSIFNDSSVPDIFNALASQWLSKAILDVSDADREQTKRVVYSVMYGVGKEKLAEYLKCTPDNAKAIMASFLLKFPAVNQFTKICVEFCQKYGYTRTIFKRRRLFPNILHRNPALRAQAERQCVNFCVQGSAADICKAAMLQVENALAKNSGLKARLLVQIHDELLLEVADSDLEGVKELIKSVMESEEKLCGSMVKLKVPIPVSVSVGKTWGKMEPVSVT